MVFCVLLETLQANAAELSLRLAGGGGLRLREEQAAQAVGELALRGDLLFPRTNEERWGLGPGASLRTGNFRSFEAALGVSLCVPTGGVSVLGLFGGAGYSLPAEPLALGVLTWGLRLPNDAATPIGLSPSAAVYLSARQGLGSVPSLELTAGLEVALSILWTGLGILTH